MEMTRLSFKLRLGRQYRGMELLRHTVVEDIKVPSSMLAGLLPDRTMELLNSSIPDKKVRVSFDVGEQWFVADFRIDLLWRELDCFEADLPTEGGLDLVASFASAGAMVSKRARVAARWKDARTVCLA